MVVSAAFKVAEPTFVVGCVVVVAIRTLSLLADNVHAGGYALEQNTLAGLWDFRTDTISL